MDHLAAHLLTEGVLARPVRFVREAEHTFSHIHWNLRVFQCEEAASPAGEAGRQSLAAEQRADYSMDGTKPGALIALAEQEEGTAPPAGYRWISEADMDTLAFPKVFLDLITEYFAKQKGTLV
jgi:A/G-specific adenine glycosylase